MTEEQFELMQKWQTIVTLMGFTMDDIFDNWSMDDDDDFFIVLQKVENVNRLIKTPTSAMTAVMRTVEMGITSNDIEEYQAELQNRAEAEKERIELEKVTNNPAIKELAEVYNFKWITDSKQYPKHKHYSFTTADGIEVRGRSFITGWQCSRNWLSWKNGDGEKVSKSCDLRGHAAVPKTFPESWKAWPISSDLNILPWIFAHRVINKTMPNGYFDAVKFKYPKK